MTTTGTQSIAARDRLSRERLAAVAQNYGALIVLAILIVAGSVMFPAFLSGPNFANIATQSSFLLIMGVGMTFVILTGGIDVSVGSVYALGGVLAAYGSQWGIIGALVLPLLICGIIGAVQGALISFAGLVPFIVTIAGMLGVRGIVYAITDGGSTTPLISDTAVIALGQNGVLGLRWPVFISLAVLVTGILVLTRFRGGQAVVAVGGSASAARLMGLPVARVTFMVYLVNGLCAGFAGALTGAYSSSGVPNVGLGLELTIISAVVIGGTLLTGGQGNLIGTLAGVLLLSVIQNLINQVGSLSSSVQSVVSGGFLAVVVVGQTLLARAQRL